MVGCCEHGSEPLGVFRGTLGLLGVLSGVRQGHLFITNSVNTILRI